MGDMGEYWRDVKPIMKRESQVRRGQNRVEGWKALAERRIPHVVKNDGAHIIVDDRIDYWPGTGLWKVRGSKQSGRGIGALLREIAKDGAK